MKPSLFLYLSLLSLPFFSSCGGDSDEPIYQVYFPIRAAGNNGEIGMLTFQELPEGGLELALSLTRPLNATSGFVKIGYGTAAVPEGTPTTLGLMGQGSREYLFNLNLLNFPLYTIQDLEEENTNIFVALYDENDFLIGFSDLGENQLSGRLMVYQLTEQNGLGVSGTATFLERQNGKTLVEILLRNTSPNGFHPVHLHAGNILAGEEAEILQMLRPVNGTTGFSMDNLTYYGAGATPISYQELLSLDGHLRVHLSETDKTVLCSGNIGGNL